MLVLTGLVVGVGGEATDGDGDGRLLWWLWDSYSVLDGLSLDVLVLGVVCYVLRLGLRLRLVLVVVVLLLLLLGILLLLLWLLVRSVNLLLMLLLVVLVVEIGICILCRRRGKGHGRGSSGLGLRERRRSGCNDWRTRERGSSRRVLKGGMGRDGCRVSMRQACACVWW